jgi:hypothetical protein
MDTLEQAVTILSLNPDKAQDEFTEARMGWSRAINERYELLQKESSPHDGASKKPFRDYAIELSAPIEIYERNEAREFVCTGSISLNNVHRIVVHTQFVEPDTEGSTTTLIAEHVQSVRHETIEAELRTGGYSSIGLLENSQGFSTYRVIDKEFIPITFQRTPYSPIEQALIRCTSRDETYDVPFERKDIIPSAPDYPRFQDPRLLERATIRTSPIR